MSISLNDNIKVLAAKATDDRYSNSGVPYISTTEANTIILASYRYLGLTINISNVEYWYKDGLLDGDLIIKTVTPTGGAWGTITGTLSSQTDLQSALNAKQNTITNSDSITQGAANLFLTTTERTKLSNTSGTNTGDQTTVSGNAGSATVLQTARNINGVSFDGSANITIVDSTKLTKAGDTITGDIANTSTGYFQLPNGTTAQRPGSPIVGMLRYNADTARHEFYSAGSWQNHVRLTGDSITGALNEAQGTNIASATTTDIGAATGNKVTVTGTTTITGLGTIQAGAERVVTFTGILILTYNVTSLILPSAANITTQVGDVVTFISLGSGNWRCSNYERADGTAIIGASIATPQIVNFALISSFKSQYNY